MKNNYPIKYALVPMIEQVGWTAGLHDLEREYGTVCYIVSKCYVIDETIKHYKDGRSENSYHVICPYVYKDYDIWKRCEPSVNDGFTTDVLFDTYEEALEVKNKKNKEIVTRQWVYIPYDEEFHAKRNNIIQKFAETLKYYDILEKEIEDKTIDLKVNNKSKEQSVFMYKNREFKYVKESLYSMMDLYDNADFKVYSISETEFDCLKNGCGIVTQGRLPLIIYDSKAKVMRLMNPGTPDKFINDGTIHDSYYGTLRRPDKNCLYFYTLETYQDIIDSYQITNVDTNSIKLVRKK